MPLLWVWSPLSAGDWAAPTRHSFPGPLRSLCGSFVYCSAAHFAVLFGSSVENQGIQTWIPSVNLPIFMLPRLQCWGSLGWAGLSPCCCSSWCLRLAVLMNLCMDVLQNCWFESSSDFVLISLFPSSFIPSFPLPPHSYILFFFSPHRPHSPHHRAARQYPKALCSVWKIFSGILQPQR